jgi:hypothetical protein
MPETPTITHGIEYFGAFLTACDLPVKRPDASIVRASLDPSDVTCAACSTRTRERDMQDGYGFTQNVTSDL